MAVYFIRHGVDDEGFRGGWSQRGLVTEGYRQSMKLGSYLKDNQSRYNVDRIISSDLQRALDTAGEIARELQLPVEPSIHWRETNNGVIAGMPNEIVDERFPGLCFSGLRMDERYPGGESPIEFYTRIKNTFTRLCVEQAQHNPAQNVIVVTHGGVINAVYHLVRGLEWSNTSRAFPALHTSVHAMEWYDAKWVISAEKLT